MSDRPPFFPTLARTFYDFESYEDVLPGGVRGGFMFVLKLALLLGLLGMFALSLQQYRVITKVVRPAFQGSPALSWKDGTLSAAPDTPYGVTISAFRYGFTVDTRETPDRSRYDGQDDAVLLTAKREMRRQGGKDLLDTPYGARYEGAAIPAGYAYRVSFAEPAILPQRPEVFYPVIAFQILVFACAGSIIVAAIQVGLKPDVRRLGAAAIWAVAAHAMAPAMTVYLVVQSALMWLYPASPVPGGPWLAWGLSIAVGITTAFLALRACMAPTDRPKTQPRKRRERSIDRDLLPPDKI